MLREGSRMDAGGLDPGVEPKHAIIVFDSVCHLCSGWVQFLLRHDRQGYFRFASLQSDTGRRLLREHGIDADDPASFLLLDADGARTDSDAMLAVVSALGGWWRLVHVFGIVPRAWRDPAYRFIARNRYRLFGRRQACWLPAPEFGARFLS